MGEQVPSKEQVEEAFNRAIAILGELFAYKQQIREVGGQQAGLERYKVIFSGQSFSEVNERLHDLGVAIRRYSASEPPAGHQHPLAHVTRPLRQAILGGHKNEALAYLDAVELFAIRTAQLPAECGGCAEFVRLQQELCELIGAPTDIDSLAMHDAIKARLSQPPCSVDWLGLALELEAQAKRVESQTVERSMTAAAHGLRLIGAYLSNGE